MDDQVRAILADVGGLAAPIADIANGEDLFAAGLTSFATVAVMLAIEEDFGVNFPTACSSARPSAASTRSSR